MPNSRASKNYIYKKKGIHSEMTKEPMKGKHKMKGGMMMSDKEMKEMMKK